MIWGSKTRQGGQPLRAGCVRLVLLRLTPGNDSVARTGGFTRDKVNELWQIDGLVYRLFDHDHTQIAVYQVIDDASRFDVGTQAFPAAENGNDARFVLAAAFDTYGLSQEVLSDNGDAFATYHWGRLSSTELWLAQKGVAAKAGFAPTAQGKDERSHKTLTRFLDARQPTMLTHVRQLLTRFRQFYNTQRIHQSLVCGKMHITPEQAWNSLPHAAPPTHPIDPDYLWARIVDGYQKHHGLQVQRDQRLRVHKVTGLRVQEVMDIKPLSPCFYVHAREVVARSR